MMMMMNSMRRTLWTLLAGVGVLGTAAAPAWAHEKGAIRLASKQLTVGGDITMTGERLPRNAVLKLQLRGTLENYPIGEVRVGPDSTFKSTLTLPQHVPVGAYTLVAIAADGDVAARTDLVIAASAPAQPTGSMKMPAGQSMPHMSEMMSGAHATAEMMRLKQTTNTGEWAVIGAFVALSFAAGAVFLRKASRLMAEEEHAAGA